MIIYYDNGDQSSELAQIDVDCEMLEQKNKYSKNIIASVETLNLKNMVSNQSVNHLMHVSEMGAKMFVDAISPNGSSKVFMPISDISLISGLSCFKNGYSLILITLE